MEQDPRTVGHYQRHTHDGNTTGNDTKGQTKHLYHDASEVCTTNETHQIKDATRPKMQKAQKKKKSRNRRNPESPKL